MQKWVVLNSFVGVLLGTKATTQHTTKAVQRFREDQQRQNKLINASNVWKNLADAVAGGRDLLEQLTIPGNLKARGQDFIEEVADRVWDKYYSTPQKDQKNFDSIKEIRKAADDIISEKIKQIENAFKVLTKFGL